MSRKTVIVGKTSDKTSGIKLQAVSLTKNEIKAFD
jgi:hypothetical protein